MEGGTVSNYFQTAGAKQTASGILGRVIILPQVHNVGTVAEKYWALTWVPNRPLMDTIPEDTVVLCQVMNLGHNSYVINPPNSVD